MASERRLGILGDVSGKRILEIGCGGAQNSIALSKWGARAIGLDLSSRQILYGRRLARKEKVEVPLILGNMETLPFKDGTFDIVTTAISLLYVPDLMTTVGEVNRVLAEDGFFAFSMEHPLNEGKLIRFRGKPAVVVRDYFKRRIVRWTDRLPDGSRVRMHSYYRTLQDYLDALTANGFVLERYVELERLEESALNALDRAQLKTDKKARRLYRFMKEAPLWVVIKARKAVAEAV